MEDFTKININQKPKQIQEAEAFIRRNLIGQQRAVRRSLRMLNIFYAGINNPRRPIGAMIFAGPSGVGKTYLAELLAYVLFDATDMYNPDRTPPITRINCSEFNKDHEISKLIGAPPGYVGHFDITRSKISYRDRSILSQENINHPHILLKSEQDSEFDDLICESKDLESKLQSLCYCSDPESLMTKRKYRKQLQELYERFGNIYSVIVFDEIEKADPQVRNILLQILNDGEVRLGSGEITKFNNSLIILTSNIGQDQIKKIVAGQPSRIGWGAIEETASRDDEEKDPIYNAVKKEIEKEFSAELLGRFGGIKGLIVFRPLKKDEIAQILNLKLLRYNRKFLQRGINIDYSEKAKKFLIEESYSELYGVRQMDAVLDKYLLDQVALIINLGYSGENIWVDFDDKEHKLVFYKKERNCILLAH